MRQPNLSADVITAINDVRGELRSVHELDASRTALVVIDMQNFFVEPGAALEVAAARDIVPNINRLASAMRDSGGTVAWIRMTFERDELSTTWTAFLPVNGGADGAATFDAIGTLTNVCCESTARDAMMLNYRVIMVDDANATITEAAHRASLDNVAMYFGDVQTTEQVLAMLAS